MHEQRAHRWANNSGDSKVTFRDGEGATPLRTTHTKRRRKEKKRKKSCPQFAGKPGRDFSGCARAPVCGCAEVRCAPVKRGALRGLFAFITANVKVRFFLKHPRVSGFLQPRVFRAHPPSSSPSSQTSASLTYLPSPPPGVTALISVF